MSLIIGDERARPIEPDLESPAMGWEIQGKSMDESMDESRVFGNPDFGKKSRFENKLVVCCKVFKVCGEKLQSCGINFSRRFFRALAVLSLVVAAQQLDLVFSSPKNRKNCRNKTEKPKNREIQKTD